MSQNQTRIALITGGSRGLGKSMALHVAAQGTDVILTYRDKEAEARAVVSEIQKTGRKAAALKLDVSSSAGFGAFADAVKKELTSTFGKERFDFLVNNAGTGVYKSLVETTEEEFDSLFDVHFKAVFFLTQKLLPFMNDGGRILNVSSGLARFTMPGFAAYASMKGGVEVLTRYMAKELGPRKIAVNVIAPGAVETDFGGGAVRDNEAMNKGIAAQTALGRVGLPDDIGGAVAMLLAPESHWMTGQRIEFSGGMFL